MTQIGRLINLLVAPIIDPNEKQYEHRITVLSRFLLVMVAFNVYRIILTGLNAFIGLDYCGSKAGQSIELFEVKDQL